SRGRWNPGRALGRGRGRSVGVGVQERSTHVRRYLPCLADLEVDGAGVVMAATKAKPAMPSVASGSVIRVASWVGVALAFGAWVAVARGATAAAEYYAAYLLELSLSVDNIFVFVIVFSELHIHAEYQRRVLAWGVAGALVFRALMITAGIALIQRFEWIMYPFGALILFAAWRMLFAEERERRVVAGACEVC